MSCLKNIEIVSRVNCSIGSAKWGSDNPLKQGLLDCHNDNDIWN